MSAQHTPGPWTVAHSTISWWIKAPTDQSGQLVSGSLPADTWHMSKEERQACPAMANARLISAAPELLDALEETWRVLRAAGLLNLTNGVQLGQTSWYVKICDAERLSDAAIAKATGAAS